uniref:Anthranilate synthase component 2 n=1 Tax=Cliftonaea pectinata TaxID=2007206 RepID=A0A1Z1MPQ0_9FLOR|nr:Anthranilate synthase component II [Cliftonaea pectinata]ARW68067.1 Anthranilate synthase component II [Cliftonaea pectinata]
MIIIIDNYDSFTQNLEQCIGNLDFKVRTIRNNMIQVKEIKELNPSHIVISPGPGNPEKSMACLDIISQYANSIPILGICLGHQAIGYVYGGKIKKLKEPTHGKISLIQHNNKDIFYKLPNPINATRYHSLIIEKNSIPSNLEITAWTQDRLIMACKHKIYKNLHGVQFHPESLWTEQGNKIIENFLYN